jgi:TonB-dependent starch-binding outer membrane protein SusC
MNPNSTSACYGKRFLSRLFSLIVGITLFVPYQLFAQTTTVTGQIKSSDGTGIAGVSVQEKGSKNGTATNTSGSFSLNVTNPNATLEISSLGYTSQDIPLSGRSSISVTLAPSSAKSLDQVVIVGYGSQRKKDLTGAVSVITAADISDRPIVNVGEALQGKAAGVEVTSNSGKPGAGLTIRVRGSSSISAGNDPLYVVDGVPLTDISAFSPDDIESISILKDAASASIYGTRAANGVVVITTKKGVAGKSKIEFSTYYGTTSATKMLSVLNAQQYQAYANEQKNSIVITDSMVKANDINWPKEVFQNGNQQNYQLSISGGTEKTQHYISLNYSDQTGIIKPANFNRLTGRVNLTTKANDWLTLITSTIISRSHNNDVTDNASVARGGVVLSALETPPTVPKFNADSTIGFNALTGWENPLGSILGSYNKNISDRLLSNVEADIKLLKGLIIRSHFGIDYANYTNTYFLDPFLTIYGRQTQGQQSQTKTNNLTWLSEQTISYTAKWGRNNFSALAGWTAQDSHTDQSLISGSFLKPQYRLLPWNESYLRDSIKAPGTTTIDDWALISYLGRLTYDFDGKYLFQANLRSDRSSKFAPGNRVATFPSFSAGWRISRESFMQSVSTINDLKLRVGWGQNGNQEGIGSYSYLPLSNIDPITGAVTATTIAPQSLTWETSTQTNVGIDATLLNSRLSFSGDYYVKKTKNVLINIPLPSQAGFATAPVNAASMQNIGEEFQVSSKNIVNGPLRWNTDLNISFNQNKILSIGEGIKFMNGFGGVYARGNAIALVQNYGLGEFYGYVADGVDPATGHQLYLTKNKTTTDNPDPSDRVLMGSAQPNFVYGLTNHLSYKNFDLTVFIQGSQGNKIFNAGRLEAEAMVNSANQSSAVLARWEKPGDKSDIPGVSVDGSTNNSLISTRFLENGSYLRFKTITLSYSINPKLLSGIGLSAITVYVSGNNLITITKYKGFDPEVNSYGNPNNSNDDRNISLGLDNGAYPQSKMFLFGLNVSLK